MENSLEGTDLDLLDEIIARNDFGEFVGYVMPALQLTEFHRAYYRILDAFARGRIRHLIVSMPPQHGKSTGSSQLLPALLLGQDPDLKIAIASYNATLASKFNKRVQRIIADERYMRLYPETRLKGTYTKTESFKADSQAFIQTSTEFDVVGKNGGLISVGREGSLTGNTVDVFILDDLYKDAMEANSPVVRENCWEWYTDVVKTRMHNTSRELIVFTRWHEEDLIGTLLARQKHTMLTHWAQIDEIEPDEWLVVNFEALKDSPPTEIDPRVTGVALWPERHSERILSEKKNLDRLRFECLYQGHPSSKEGLLYGTTFQVYDTLPDSEELVGYHNYTDTADTGDDYLCSVSYVKGRDGRCYVTEIVYTREPMEKTEPMVAEMLIRANTRRALIESNNGGRGFARAVMARVPGVYVEWFHQSANKEARILSNSATVLQIIIFPSDWGKRWPEFYYHMTTYRRQFRANRWHDAADVLTGIVEKETGAKNKIKSIKFTN